MNVPSPLAAPTHQNVNEELTKRARLMQNSNEDESLPRAEADRDLVHHNSI